MSKIFLTWLALLALELGVSFVPFSPTARPLILIPALVMLGVILTSFMQVGQGPVIVRLFAAAGLLWLVILLAVGSLDPLTRVVYPVTSSASQAPRHIPP
jgi:cytochrome c oxidase subunit 4